MACIRKLEVFDNKEQENPQYITTYGFEQLRKVWVFNRQPCIEMSSVELVELSLILGMKLYLRLAESSSRIYGIGAFGTLLDGHIEDGVWRIRIIHGNRDRSEGTAKGSGYSTLHAKYIACGCLPFGQSKGWIEYVHLNSKVWTAIKGGHDICDAPPPEPATGPARQAKNFLKELSTIGRWSCYNEMSVREGSAKVIQPYGQFIDQGGNPRKRARDNIVASWSMAVAYVAFGGLVPQSADDLANAIKFTIFGDTQLDTARKQQQGEILEKIANAVHERHKKEYLFGPFVGSRTKNSRMDQVYAPMNSVQWDVRLAAATFSRYMTLIEYFVAHFTVLASDEPDHTQREIKKRKLRDSCGRRDVAFDALCKVLKESHENAVDKIQPEIGFIDELEQLPQKFKDGFDISQKDVTNLAKCVIAVWAEYVPRIVVKVSNDQSHTIPFEEVWNSKTQVGFDLDFTKVQRRHKHINMSHFTRGPDEEVYHAPALQDLPSIAAFG